MSRTLKGPVHRNERCVFFDLTKAVKVVTDTQRVADVEEPEPSARFKKLPEHIRLEDTITSQDPDAPPDPTMGRDPNRDFMLRNAGG
jgi:hypothetical protein